MGEQKHHGELGDDENIHRSYILYIVYPVYLIKITDNTNALGDLAWSLKFSEDLLFDRKNDPADLECQSRGFEKENG